jgi:hypothetical protein
MPSNLEYVWPSYWSSTKLIKNKMDLRMTLGVDNLPPTGMM